MRTKGIVTVSIGLVLLLVAEWPVVVTGQSTAVFIKARKIYTVTQGILENGQILVQDGKVKEVGQKVTPPVGAREYSAEVVIPGLVDAHTHMALRRMGTRSPVPDPFTSEWKAVENLDLGDPMIPIALSGGVTTIMTGPGSGIISSGQSVALKLRSKPDKSMILKPYVALKMAVRSLIGIRPGHTPATLMGWYASASEHFRRAKVYLQQIEDHKAGRRAEPPPRDEELEALAAAIRGDVMVHVHAFYPSEIQMVLHLAKQYGFIDRLSFAHMTESWPIADVLAKYKVFPVAGYPVVVRYWGDTRSHNVVKELMDAGVPASVQTDQSGEEEKCFREYGSILVRNGLSEERALEAVTINGAKALMLADRIGSIEVGKDADLVLMDGPPFDLHAERVERVFVDGVLEYERKELRQPNGLTAVGPFRPLKGTLAPDRNTFALTNAHLFTVSHGNLKNATIVVNDGKITQIQEGGAAPKGLPVMDVGGRVVSPGWVTARAYPNNWTGDLKWQVQNNEDIEPISPEMHARFAVDPWFPSYATNREIGLTTENITPGLLNLIGGTGVVVKMRTLDLDVMVRREPSCMVFTLTSNAGRPWAGNSKIPITLQTVAQMIRQTLDDAKKYLAAGDGRDYNQQFEALRPALDRTIPVVIHAGQTEEIHQALELASDYNLRLIISGGTEAWKLADELAKASVPVILGDSATDVEAIRGGGRGYNDQGPLLLSRAGVKVGFFGYSGSRRGQPTGRLGGEPALNAMWAFRNGVPEEEAFRMATLYPAQMFEMDDRIGSLDVGKDADFMVLAGHPLDYRALPDLVLIDGYVVHQSEAAQGRVTSSQ